VNVRVSPDADSRSSGSRLDWPCCPGLAENMTVFPDSPTDQCELTFPPSPVVTCKLYGAKAENPDTVTLTATTSSALSFPVFVTQV